MNQNPPVRVAVTGAAGQISYSLLFRLAAGAMLGARQPVILQLLEITPALAALRGTVMELEDCALPLLAGVVQTDDPAIAFKDADYCLLVGARPRGPGMERKDLLEANAKIFAAQGAAIAAHASPQVKVLVVGNPANTNALIACRNASGLAPRQFTAMTRLDHNRAIAQLAQKTGCHSSQVEGMIIWGNHSSTQYPDVHHCTITGAAASAGQAAVPSTNQTTTASTSAGQVTTASASAGQTATAATELVDNAWLREEFIPTVQQRGAAIIKARGLSSAASAANAAIEHMRDWACGTEGRVVSMAVPSDGSYGIEEGLIFSFPCTCADGEYSIVQGLELNRFSRDAIEASEQELKEERDAIASLLP